MPHLKKKGKRIPPAALCAKATRDKRLQRQANEAAEANKLEAMVDEAQDTACKVLQRALEGKAEQEKIYVFKLDPTVLSPVKQRFVEQGYDVTVEPPNKDIPQAYLSISWGFKTGPSAEVAYKVAEH